MKKILCGLAFIILATVLIIGCETEQGGRSDKVFEKVEFPIIDYTIDPSEDTTIFGPQGTRIFIGSQTFRFSDGSPVKSLVTIKLKEFYKKSDIILADLSTRSGEKLLETGGMIHIEASSNGEKVEIRPDKRIVVHFPKEQNDFRKMDLFYSSQTATDTSVTDWDVNTESLVKTTLKLGSFGWWYPSNDDSTSYDFTPANYVDSGYYWNPIDFYISSYKFSEQTKREVETSLNRNDYPDFESWNDYGVECEMKISTRGYIKDPKIITKVSSSTRQEIITFLKNLPQLKPGTNKYEKIIERKGLLFIQGGNTIPLYKTDEEYVKSFDSKYAKFEGAPIKDIKRAEVNYYIFSVSELGWINCDRFIDSDENVNLLAQVPVNPDTELKMVFRDFDGVIKADIRNGNYVFSNVPKGQQVTIIAIKYNRGQLLTAFKEITITDNPIDNLAFSEITLAELKRKLEDI